MPKITYIDKRFRASSLELINQINEVIDNYKALGYDLTLRQVYYQLVSRNIVPNTEKSYKNIGNLINDGRLAGLIDWYAIEDRTRNLAGRIAYDDPADIINQTERRYHLDYWKGQENRVEVWVEKDALKSIVGQACYPLDVDYFSCRGYTSQSEMWIAAKRMINKQAWGHCQRQIIIHLGDHDPSGKDMSRDIEERLRMFGVQNLEFKRIALNMDQIEEYGPPPNPAKLSDSRANGYIEEYGYDSWELDALRPEIISALIQTEIEKYMDKEWYLQVKAQEDADKDLLLKVADNWDYVVNILEDR